MVGGMVVLMLGALKLDIRRLADKVDALIERVGKTTAP